MVVIGGAGFSGDWVGFGRARFPPSGLIAFRRDGEFERRPS